MLIGEFSTWDYSLTFNLVFVSHLHGFYYCTYLTPSLEQTSWGILCFYVTCGGKKKLTDTTTHLWVQGILSLDLSFSPSVMPKQPDNPYLAVLSHTWLLLKYALLTVLLNIILCIVLRLLYLRSLPVPDVSLRIVFTLPCRNSSICCNWKSFIIC